MFKRTKNDQNLVVELPGGSSTVSFDHGMNKIPALQVRDSAGHKIPEYDQYANNHNQLYVQSMVNNSSVQLIFYINNEETGNTNDLKVILN